MKTDFAMSRILTIYHRTTGETEIIGKSGILSLLATVIAVVPFIYLMNYTGAMIVMLSQQMIILGVLGVGFLKRTTQ